MSTHAELVSNAVSAGSTHDWKRLYGVGGWTALALLVYSVATMLILVLVGGQPATAREGFEMLQQNRLAGLLRLDVLSILVMPLYYVLFLAVFIALRQKQEAYVTLATLLLFAGLTLFLATPSAFSWLALSDNFASSTSVEHKTLLLAAGEAILASDMWHGSGPVMGGVLLQTGAFAISLLMLGRAEFGKATAYVGIVTHGLDLIHMLFVFIMPSLSVMLMVIAGPLYLIWFPLLARDLFRLGRS